MHELFMTRIKLLLILFLLPGSFHPSLFSEDHQKRAIVGYWEGIIEGEDFTDRYIYHFYFNRSGELRGDVYSLRNGVMKSRYPITEVRFHDRDIRFVVEGKFPIKYKGYLIQENQTIGGKLYYPNGTSVPWTLRKLRIHSIREIVKTR